MEQAFSIVIETQIGKRLSLLDLWNLRATCKSVHNKLVDSFDEKTQYPIKKMLQFLIDNEKPNESFFTCLDQKGVRIFGSAALWVLTETIDAPTWKPSDIDVHIPFNYDFRSTFAKSNLTTPEIEEMENDLTLEGLDYCQKFILSDKMDVHFTAGSPDHVDLDLCGTKIWMENGIFRYTLRSVEGTIAKKMRVVHMYSRTSQRIEKYRKRNFVVDTDTYPYKNYRRSLYATAVRRATFY